MPERCVDASLAIKWVIKGEAWRKRAMEFLRDSINSDFALIAPPLYEYETESVIQQRLHSGTLTVVEANTALAQLAVTGVQMVTHPIMIKRARELARQFDQPRIYDSLYAALAELRGCEFWTADRSFYNSVTPALSFVKYLADYT